MPTLLEISNQVGQKYKKNGTLLEYSATQKPKSNIEKTFNKPPAISSNVNKLFSKVYGLGSASEKPQGTLMKSSVKKQSVPVTTTVSEIKQPLKQESALKQATSMATDQTFETGKKVGKWFLDLSKSIFQAPQRTITQFGLEPVAGVLSFAKDKRVEPVFIPKTKFEKAIFGEEPIKGIFTDFDTWDQKGQQIAGNNLTLKGASIPLTSLMFGGLKSLDLVPITGPEKEIVKRSALKIAESKSAPEILESLYKVFKGETDDVLKPLADELVDITDKKVVENFLGNLVKDSKKSGGLKNVLSVADEALATSNKVDNVVTKTKGVVDNIATKTKTIAEDTGTKAKGVVYDTPKQIEKKLVAQVFRSDKLNLPIEQLVEIESRLGALGLDQRSVRTFKEIETAAQSLGTDVQKLLRETSSNRITSDEIVALRNNIKTHSDFIVQANEQLKNTALKADEIKKIKDKIEISENTIDASLSKLVKGGTEAGRAVAAFRIMANKTIDPVFWLEKAKKVSGKDAVTGEVHDAILDLISKNDAFGLAQFMAMLRNPSTTEKAMTLWKAGLLTSFTTHTANVLGNTSMRLLLDATELVKIPFDVLASLFTRERTTLVNPKLIMARVRGLVSGAKKAKNYLKDGMYDDDFIKKWDIPKMVNFRNKLLNGYTQAVFRSLGAEDAIFRRVAMQESLEKQAMLMVKKEGLSGAQAVDRVRQLLVEPTNAMIAEAVDTAEYATFQSKNALNDLIMGAKRAVRGKGITEGAVEFIAPFSKTPTNVAARIADFSPIGFVKALVNVARPSTRSQKVFVDDISRAITGTGMIALGAYLAKKGLMTGGIPKDQQERDDFYAAGKQANSIYLFGQWHQLNRISPIGNLLSLGASFEKLSQDKQGLDLAASTGATGLKSLTEQTFLKGVSGGLSAINDPERNAAKYIEQSVASSVPTGVAKIARVIDPRLRDPQGIWQTVKNRIPLMSEDLPVTRDVFGHAVNVSGGRLSIVDPFSRKKPTDYPALKEANRVGVNIGKPDQTLRNTKLDNREYSIYQKVQGNLLEKTLNNIIQSDGYKAASDENKKKIIEKTITKVRETSGDMVYPRIIAARYNLPETVPPEAINKIMSSLNKVEAFKKMSEEEKEGKIKEIISKLQ